MVDPRAPTPLDPAYLWAALTSLVPVRVSPPQLPIPWPSSLGLVVPYRASSIVGRYVGDPAPWVRATGQVNAFETRGTDNSDILYGVRIKNLEDVLVYKYENISR